MIRLTNVCKTYCGKKRKKTTGIETKALVDVSLILPDSGLIFLTGKSGSGKSTLLNLTGGLDSADSGEISFNGKSFSSFSPKDYDAYRNAYVGFVFQEFNLIESISVRDNLSLALSLQRQEEKEEKIREALAEVDLAGFEDRHIDELSGGQKQRVAIARALIKKPQVILADEPTGSLDSKTSADIFSLFARLAKDRLVLVVTHDEEAAKTYGDRNITLSDGKIVSDTSPLNKAEEPNSSSSSFSLQKGMKLKDNLHLSFLAMKTRKTRLIFTAILSAFALFFFGSADLVLSFDKVNALSSSLSQYDDSLLRLKKNEIPEDSLEFDNTPQSFSDLSQEDVSELEQETGLSLTPVPSSLSGFDVASACHYGYFGEESARLSSVFLPLNIDGKDGSSLSLLSGSFPQKDNECLISDVRLEYLRYFGLQDNLTGDRLLPEQINPQSVIGHHVRIESDSSQDFDFVISGVYDTGFDFDRFASLHTRIPDQTTDGQEAFDQYYEKNRPLANELTRICMKTSSRAIYLTPSFYNIFSSYQGFGSTRVLLSSSAWDGLIYQIEGTGLPQDNIVFLDGKAGIQDDDFVLSAAKIDNFIQIAASKAGKSDYSHSETISIDEEDYKYVLGSGHESDIPQTFSFYVSGKQSDITNAIFPFAAYNVAFEKMDSYLDLYSSAVNSSPFVIDGRSPSQWKNQYVSGSDSEKEKAKKELAYYFSQLIIDENSQINKQSVIDNSSLLDPTYRADISSLLDTLFPKYLAKVKQALETRLLNGLASYPELLTMTLSKRKEDDSEDPSFTSRKLNLAGINLFGSPAIRVSPSLYQALEPEVTYSSVVFLNPKKASDLKKVSALVSRYPSPIPGAVLKAGTYYCFDNIVYSETQSTSVYFFYARNVFFVLAIIFALFAMLMLYHLLSYTIKDRRKEIGILRSLGANGRDIFLLFYNEALFIVLLASLIGFLGVIIADVSANAAFSNYFGIGLTLLVPGIRQLLVLLLFGLVISLLATIAPLSHIAKEKPIEAIKHIGD